jgi:ribosome maturation factor RimP
MITTKMLTEALERHLEGTPHFLVHAEVRPSGKAIVEVDNDKAITLNDLAAINKGLRETFGDALDDLELEVSSPGMGRPFRVKRQFQKHTGRLVEVLKTDGKLLRAQLVAFDDDGITVKIEQPSKVKGRLPKLEEKTTAIPFADIRSTQASINFN